MGLGSVGELPVGELTVTIFFKVMGLGVRSSGGAPSSLVYMDSRRGMVWLGGYRIDPWLTYQDCFVDSCLYAQ